jgi:endonuclease/exonuclease/phosphatase family metal-dependent hydrolase
MEFKTAVGAVQVLNVHLRPAISDSGSWIRGYLTTADDRLREIERFYNKRRPGLPTVVVGDFNDREDSPVIGWLKSKGMVNALPEFDRSTPTWRWRYGVVSFSRRMDHVVYSQELRCCSARVIQAGASDHYPVEAVFAKSGRVTP